ncbi:MAG: hypothetical protein JW874_04410 [Spirochaetales bacterium]|nr:hypothetical protein [Spirochaetales bacterium]
MKRKLTYIFALAALVLAGCAGGGSPKEAATLKLEAANAALKTDGNLIVGDTSTGQKVVAWWEKTSDEVSWDLAVENGGDYAVSVKIACDPQFPGSVVEVKIGDQSLEFTVPDTGAWEQFKVMDIGTVKLKKGTYPVLVKAKSVKNRFVCNLMYVNLVSQ